MISNNKQKRINHLPKEETHYHVLGKDSMGIINFIYCSRKRGRKKGPLFNREIGPSLKYAWRCLSR